MLPSPLNKRLIALCLALAAGCTFTDGQPWAKVEPALSVSLDAADRLDEQGRIRAGDGYLVALDDATLQLGALTLAARPSGGAVVFDPASPPPGYSLCHNGHCHADDGRLVDYEDVQVELAEAQGVASSVTQAIDQPAPLAPDGQLARLQLDPALCADGCEMALGELSAVSVTAPSATLALRVFDSRAPSRLPAEGVVYTLDLPLDWRSSAPVSGAIDKETPVRIVLDARLAITPRLFDGADWASADEQALIDVITKNIKERSTLEVDLQRLD